MKRLVWIPIVTLVSLAVAGCSERTNDTRPPIATSPAKEPISVGALSSSLENVEVEVTCSGLTQIEILPDEPVPDSIPTSPITVIRENSSEEEIELRGENTAPDGFTLISATLQIENQNDSAARFDVSQPKFYLPQGGSSALSLVGTIDPLMRTAWSDSDGDDKRYWQVEVPPHSSVEIEIIHMLPSEALGNQDLLFSVTRGQGSESGASGLQGYRVKELMQ